MAQVRAFNSLIAIVLVFSLIMGVYCAGTSKTYDFKKHIESIAAVSEELPTFQTLYDIWSEPMINITDMGLIVPESGFFARFILGGNEKYYVFSWFDVADWGMFEPINQFISGVVEFMGRIVFTGYWGGTFVVHFFDLVFAISPTSGLVERGSF